MINKMYCYIRKKKEVVMGHGQRPVLLLIRD